MNLLSCRQHAPRAPQKLSQRPPPSGHAAEQVAPIFFKSAHVVVVVVFVVELELVLVVELEVLVVVLDDVTLELVLAVVARASGGSTRTSARIEG